MAVFLAAVLVVFAGPLLGYDGRENAQHLTLESFSDSQGFSVTHDSLTDRYILKKADEEIILAPGIAQARICGFTVPLAAPVKIESGRVVVPAGIAGRLAEVRERLKQQTPSAKKSEFVIVLDPGHGPVWYGGISQDGLTENHITLPIAKVVKAQLEKKGYKIVLTRSTNAHLDDASRSDDLNARVTATHSARGDIFVSIHANSTNPPDPYAVGVETFYYPPFPVGSSGLGLDERAAQIARTYPGAGYIAGAEFSGDAAARAAVLRAALEANTFRSRALAESLQRALVEATGDVDRGVKNDNNLRVLRLQACPAALVEIGFLTNPATAKRLRSASFRNSVAKSIAEGIDRFVRTDAAR